MKILCFEWFLHKIALFFKNLNFPDFQYIEVVARPIEIVIKNLVWICLAQSVLDWCSIDRNLNSECFKKSFLTCSSLFSKLFKHSSHYCRPIEIRTMSVLKRVFSRVLHYFQNFWNTPFTTFLWPIQSKPFFIIFFHKSLKGFCPRALLSLFYPFFFN